MGKLKLNSTLNVAGRATHAFHIVVYPMMLEDGVVWVMRGAITTLTRVLEKEEFSKLQKAIIPPPKQLELAVAQEQRKKLAPETINIQLV